MTYRDFLHKVQSETNLNEQQAEKAVQATLHTLGERLTENEASDLAAQLPEPLKRPLREPRSQQKLTLDDFIGRIAQQEDCGRDEAFRHAQAVFQVLCEAVSHGEMSDVMSQLPKDFREAFSCNVKTLH